MTAAPRALARIEHSEALLAALRRRLDELQLTHEIIDHLTGFQNGYSSKLLADPPQRRLGHFSLFVLLQTLGLDMVLVENPQALEGLKNPALRRRQAWVLKAPRIVVLTPDFLRMIGTKGGRARVQKLSKQQHSKHARYMNRIRWDKERLKHARMLQNMAREKRTIRTMADGKDNRGL
jgi:hypothetical protein